MPLDNRHEVRSGRDDGLNTLALHLELLQRTAAFIHKTHRPDTLSLLHAQRCEQCRLLADIEAELALWERRRSAAEGG